MSIPALPAALSETFAHYRADVNARLLQIRSLIFTTAADMPDVGPLTETLKWGEAAYLTEASGSGTTIRLGTTKSAPDCCAVFVNCQTTLISDFRSHFADDFIFEGNRALIIPAHAPLPKEPLILCLRSALTYHQHKKQKAKATTAGLTA
ncbi:DUF1801 domain-containing protein [Thalassospira sp. TSL5-1]|uniref:DUF1801 domain-containing protein n=1 Tax=Thalassospira sp. TSL5-1 TaxID=1544451 RepID=UPI00093A4C2C|nr:DUF1801 domain-containing protein [Thalassospira sp. TSL5-1]OKH87836.1 hypothetical protein LF95_14015 [Thalassospira sp. TSL5-1]